MWLSSKAEGKERGNGGRGERRTGVIVIPFKRPSSGLYYARISTCPHTLRVCYFVISRFIMMYSVRSSDMHPSYPVIRSVTSSLPSNARILNCRTRIIFNIILDIDIVISQSFSPTYLTIQVCIDRCGCLRQHCSSLYRLNNNLVLVLFVKLNMHTP